jgi:hypothetical protein
MLSIVAITLIGSAYNDDAGCIGCWKDVLVHSTVYNLYAGWK